MHKNASQKPVPIGITMGCPVGIGPEIILKYFANREAISLPPAVIIGDINVLRAEQKRLGLDIAIKSWDMASSLEKKCIQVLDISTLDMSNLHAGRPSILTGKAMASYITHAVTLCLEGKISSIVTCPITKKILNEAGYNFPGHTEMLAELTGTRKVVMMMAGKRLTVTLATIHCALRNVSAHLSQQSLEELISITHDALRNDFGLLKPRIGVAGCNPHAGEDGLFGSEEQQIIAPVVSKAARSGINISGPHPPDTVFYNAASGLFDAVICMYHDQGLIPFKLLHFSDGVNITLGLPIVRTSVDHGTAYDIAGKGIADYRSLEAAVEMAARIVKNRSRLAES